MNQIASREDWLAARRALLAKEKQATRLRDTINAERLALPWVRIETPYAFETETGRKSLVDLFEGRGQLLVYHFMLAPGWDAGCPGCSFVADHFGGALAHLNNHDVTLTALSRAPLSEIKAYKARMGWSFPWASSADSSFNYDFGVSFDQAALDSGKVLYNYRELASSDANAELPGLSAFALDESGRVCHTYSTYARGVEEFVGALMLLDRAPKGRNETAPMSWVRRHDEYANARPSGSPCAS